MRKPLFTVTISLVLLTLSSFFWSFPGSWRGKVDQVKDMNVFLLSEPYHDYDIVGVYPVPIAHGQPIDSYIDQMNVFAGKLELSEYEGIILEDFSAQYIISRSSYGQSLSDVDEIEDVYVYARSKPVRDYKVVAEIKTGLKLRPMGGSFRAHLRAVIKKHQLLVDKDEMDPFEAIITEDGNTIEFIKFTLPYFRQVPRR